MKRLTPDQMAWLLPVTMLAHQLEEYFGEFPLWYSNILDAELSNQDFIMINSIGIILITTLSLSYIFTRNNMVMVALGTLIFANGIIHIAVSIFTFSYSPGAITSLVLFLPLVLLLALVLVLWLQ